MQDLGIRWAERIADKFSPMSVFLYGSRAKGDFVEESDWELGVVFKRDKKPVSGSLRKFVIDRKVMAFSFVYEDLLELTLDTPFPKAGYYRDLVLGGKTLVGENVLSEITPPPIRVSDLIEVVAFNLGYALASVHEFRRGANEFGANRAVKANMYGVRAFEMLELRKFPLTYSDVFSESKNIELGEYESLIEQAQEWRETKKGIDEGFAYRNLSFLNTLAMPRLKERLKEDGDVVVVK